MVKTFLVSFGPIPEVPEGYLSCANNNATLKVVCARALAEAWNEQSNVYGRLTRAQADLREADTIYVYLGEVESKCTREDCLRLLRWIACRRIIGGGKRLVAVAYLKDLDLSSREEEREKIRKMGAEVDETHDRFAREFFGIIVRGYHLRS